MNECPSFGACASASAPLIVFAPGTASTITGWPRRAASFSAINRFSTSIAPPGLNGEISLTVFMGHATGCAAD
jgi:hypothetical protein